MNLCFHILGISSSQLTFIFFRGAGKVYHQPDKRIYKDLSHEDRDFYHEDEAIPGHTPARIQGNTRTTGSWGLQFFGKPYRWCVLVWHWVTWWCIKQGGAPVVFVDLSSPIWAEFEVLSTFSAAVNWTEATDPLFWGPIIPSRPPCLFATIVVITVFP